jgi:hypothetical protein
MARRGCGPERQQRDIDAPLGGSDPMLAVAGDLVFAPLLPVKVLIT